MQIYATFPIFVLRFYVFASRLTGIPVFGGLVRRLMQWYGKTVEGGEVITLEQAKDLVVSANHCSLGECPCRRYIFHADGKTIRDCCIRLDYGSQVFVRRSPEKYRPISKEELLLRLEEFSRKHNLFQNRIHFLAPNVYAICNCGRSCVPYDFYTRLGITTALKPNHLVAAIDQGICTRCGVCQERCYFAAIKDGTVDSGACLGCGLCRWSCPLSAIAMVEREEFYCTKDAHKE